MAEVLCQSLSIRKLKVTSMTHTKNIALIDLAHHLPSAILHSQGASMKPLSLYSDEAVRICFRGIQGELSPSIRSPCCLGGGTYLKAVTTITAVNGFRKTGVVPYNPVVISDADFAGSHPTDIDCDVM